MTPRFPASLTTLCLALCAAFSARAQTTAGDANSADPAAPSQRVEVTGANPKGYGAKSATAATKGDTPLLETPMAVQVVPREVINDRQERTSLDAVKNVSGVQSSYYEFYDQFLIRGFDSGYGTTFRNGLQLRGITEAVNMAFVDHIEVVKGPASMLYGRIEPGGFVNIVTKQPQEAPAYSLEQQVGRWGMLRTAADATGKLSDDGRLRYRVTAALDKSDSWVANAHYDNQALAASLSWKPSAQFDASLQLEHYNTKTAWLDASVPVLGNRPANVPRNFSIIDPVSWSDFPYTARRTLVALEWHYAFNDAWKLTHRFHYVGSSENQQGVYLDGFDGVDTFANTRFTRSGPGWTRRTLATNLDLSGEFATGDIKHKLLVGVDWSSFTDDTPGSTGDLTGAAPVNIYHPVFGNNLVELQALAASDASNMLWRDKSTDAGLYLQDQIALNAQTDLLLGGRFDRAEDAYADTYGSRDSACYPHCTASFPTTPYATDTAFSPRAGLLYKLSPTASVYASYAQSFGSSNGRDNLGNRLQPQVGTQYELGAKALLAGGRVTASATLFELTKTNITEYDPTNFFPHVVGEARSRGLELDLAGQVSANWSVIGSYTYDQAVITNDPYSGTQGKRLSGVAPQVLSIWAKFDTAPGAAEGFAWAAGWYGSSQRQGDDLNTWQLPGYGRVDAMVAYRTRLGATKLAAQLNLNNLLDQRYFEHGGYGVAAYGAPRHLIASVKADF